MTPGAIPNDCTCFSASFFEEIFSTDAIMEALDEKLSLFADRVVMIPNPNRRSDFFKDRLHKSFDIRRLALQHGVDIHMEREVHGKD
jgi:hypothetical protein